MAFFGTFSLADRDIGSSHGKQFLCSQCQRSFRRGEHLQRHLRTHSKEKPFGCHCGLSFARKDLLRRHERMAHEGAALSEDSTNDAVERGENDSTGPNLQYLPSYPEAVQTNSTAPHSSEHPVFGINDDPSAVGHMLPCQNQTASFDPYLDDPNGQLQEIYNFIDSLGLAAEWGSGGFDQDVQDPDFSSMSFAGDPAAASGNDSNKIAQTGADEPQRKSLAAFRTWLPSPPTPEGDLRNIDNRSGALGTMRGERCWHPIVQVSSERRQALESTLKPYRRCVPNFKLPSEHTMTRYLTCFFEGSHSHAPFIHLPTAELSQFTPDVILSFAAAGAQYCFEYQNGDKLFRASRAILLERMQEHRLANSWEHRAFNGGWTSSGGSTDSASLHDQGLGINSIYTPDKSRCSLLQSLRAATVLTGYGAWSQQALVRDSLSLLSTIMAECMRELSLSNDRPEAVSQESSPWLCWAQEEMARRIQLVAFTWLNTLTLAYGSAPTVLNREIQLKLPATCKAWISPTEEMWKEEYSRTKGSQQPYHAALAVLCGQYSQNSDGSNPLPGSTPFGNYILLHGLLQRILTMRDLCGSSGHTSNTGLPAHHLTDALASLRAWTRVWQETPGSSLDPGNADGPIPFTSSALLGLAYVRLHLDLGPFRRLASRDHHEIASGLLASPPLQRHPDLIPALVYAVHALSIPVMLGIQRVARSQAFFWSVPHGLASSETAVFLFKWLQSLQTVETLEPMEQQLLEWVRQLLDEAASSMDDDETSLGNPTSASRFGLGIMVLKVWSAVHRHNVQWPFLNLLGHSLGDYAARMGQFDDG